MIAWIKLKKARESYKDNISDFDLQKTQDDPYWIGRPGTDSEGVDWDYGALISQKIKTEIEDDWDPDDVNDDPETSSYWGEDKLNRLSNLLLQRGTYEYLPCHIYEQNMNPSSPWFGVFWNWHSNVHEDIKLDGDHRDGNGNLKELGNPYSTVFRYLYDPDGNIYSNWKDQEFPRIGPFTSNLGHLLARYYSLGSEPIGNEKCLQGDGYQPTFGLGFMRDANPFSKHAQDPRPSVGIRNRLVLALLHQFMTHDQNGDNPYFNDDYRGGATAFVANALVPLLDVYPDIGTDPMDIFQGDEAEEVKDIIKTGVMHMLERSAGINQCSAHNQWVHAWIALAKGAACFNDSAVDYLFLMNIKKSDNRYNHGVPVWQESSGYDNIYSAFSINACAMVRSYLLQRRFNILDFNDKNGIVNSEDPVLKNFEILIRDFESQVNDLTDYWNHTILMEPDGSIAGACDMNSRVDSAHWASLPQRFIQFIGKPYGSTLTIPEMDACQTLVTWTTGRQYEGWNDMIRKWQHNVPDPYNVSYNFDTNIGDGVSIEDKRDYILEKVRDPETGAYNKERFREDFSKDASGNFLGFNGGVCPKVPRDKPRPAGHKWMDKDSATVYNRGIKYAIGGIPEDDISDQVPNPLPAHVNRSFVKVWPSYHKYYNNPTDGLRVYTNQNNVFLTADERPNIGGVSVKTGTYYSHIHTDGWNLPNQATEWKRRRNDQFAHDPEYMWAMTAFGGGMSLLTTPENGGVIVGRRKGFWASNQIFFKRYTKVDELGTPLPNDAAENADLGGFASQWNDAVIEDGCGYAWACPAATNAVATWVSDQTQSGEIGTLTHKQTLNYNFLTNPTDDDGHNTTSFAAAASYGSIGWIEREYVFNENNIVCTVRITPFMDGAFGANINWDEVYMTIPLSVMGRGYKSGDQQYTIDKSVRELQDRSSVSRTDFGDDFEIEKTGCWKREVITNGNKVTIGHTHFSEFGTEFEFTTPGIVDRIERLVSGPGTDPLYPQRDVDAPIQNGNFLWPPTQELLDKHPQMKAYGSTPEELLQYCRGGRHQGDDHPDLPLGWTVPAPAGYSSKEGPGKELDDGLKIQFGDLIRNTTNFTEIEFSYTITPGKPMSEADE